MEEIRLQKLFTDCGILSRRAAEEEIRKGLVTVNGQVATIGQKIDPMTDTVAYRGKVIAYRPERPRHYFLLNKPRGYVTTLSDEKGRRTAASLLAREGVRLYPVGRLDMDSDGLLLFTDDGALTERLTHPRHEIPKLYRVCVAGEVSAAQLERLSAPFLLDGYRTLPARVRALPPTESGAALEIELYEGRNRQIRRMCAEVGLRVLSLTRIAIGRITLGDLPIGHYRPLTEEELAYLKGEAE